MDNTDQADKKLKQAMRLFNTTTKLMNTSIMKLSGSDTAENVEIKESLSALLGARLRVGQTLFFSYKTLNRKQKKPLVSIARFLKAVNTSYPALSYRSLQRCFRVFERLVVKCGMWIEDLETIDFTILARVAECKKLNSITRRNIIDEIRQKLNSGVDSAKIAKQLGYYLAQHRENPEKIPEKVLKYDARLSEVKMDFEAADSDFADRSHRLKVPKKLRNYGPGTVFSFME